MGNFPSAINAYSEAIKISPALPKLYINRASCYIVLNLYEDAVIDCTRALELLTPPVEANRLSRVRTLAKRGSAYCQLGSLSKGNAFLFEIFIYSPMTLLLSPLSKICLFPTMILLKFYLLFELFNLQLDRL